MATVMDISMGHLLGKTIGMGMTVEMKTQFLRPARKGIATVEGSFVKKGVHFRLWKAGFGAKIANLRPLQPPPGKCLIEKLAF